MNRPRVFTLLLLSLLLLQLVAADQAWGQEGAPGASASDGAVLVANTAVDLKWDPSRYSGSADFARWELRRGLSQAAMAVIASTPGRPS